MTVKQEKNMKQLVRVGKVAELMLSGYSASDIAKKLDLSESIIRAYMGKIREIVDTN